MEVVAVARFILSELLLRRFTISDNSLNFGKSERSVQISDSIKDSS